jgi:hypothetical protein
MCNKVDNELYRLRAQAKWKQKDTYWMVEEIMWLGMYQIFQSYQANAEVVPWNRLWLLPSTSFPFTSYTYDLILLILHKHSSWCRIEK